MKWPEPFTKLFIAVCVLLVTSTSVIAQSGTQRSLPRVPVDIRNPEPDSANFPNSAFTISKGRLYIENAPVGVAFRKDQIPGVYAWQFLIRYGWTDRIELRVFSNGLTVRGGPDTATGFSPLAFDVKLNLLDKRKKRFIPSVGTEIYVQTDLGSSAFDSGTFPSVNILFDHNLPGGITFEYNIGATREQGLTDRFYVFSFPWSFTREIVDDVNCFVQGFQGSPAIPRVREDRTRLTRPRFNAVGAGFLWTASSRVAVWSSYNFGTTQDSPNMLSLGFAVAF